MTPLPDDDVARLVLPAPGTRVIVTGGRGGIGRRLVDRLAAAGCRPLALDRPRTDADVTADLTDPSAATAAVDEAAERLGGLDAVVGAAGVVDTIHRASTFPDDAFTGDVAANLHSQFFVARAAHRHLTALPPEGHEAAAGGSTAPGGSAAGTDTSGASAIVMVSSVAGLDGLTGQAAYASAKAGVVGLVRSLAAEWAVDGIRVNGVAPGLTATPKVTALPDATRDRLLATVPLGRIAALDEVVGPILYLLSPAAGYTTGQVLRLDGGAGLGVGGLFSS